MTSVSALAGLVGSSTAATKNKASSVEDMNSQDFLTLMVAQLKNQDPTKPMDNAQFMSELAQFGTVSGVQDLNKNFTTLASSLTSSQNLQAIGLVGREVTVDSNVGSLTRVEGSDELALKATVTIPSGASAANLYIKDAAGRLVYSAPLNSTARGEQSLSWDGKSSEGQLLATGSYQVSVEALVGGKSTALSVYARQRVDSVSFDSSGAAQLKLADGQTVGMTKVKAYL
ncbi:MAG: flagellar hook assembly protein FlgD [Parahaliea sp.]